MTRRPALTHAGRALAATLSALALALVLTGLIAALSGDDALKAGFGLLEGMVGSGRALAESGAAACPFILAGLAVALGLRGGVFNIGVEGQLVMGALGSALAGYGLTGLPAWLHLPLALAAGALAGALWAAIPGLLKVRCGAHEVITTIMMNYLSFKLTDYLVKNPLRDPAASADRTRMVLDTARLPLLLGPDYRLHAGFLLSLAAACAVWFLLRGTTLGFTIRAAGASPGAARYAGLPSSRITVAVMALSGALAGLAGAGELLGLEGAMPASFGSGQGFEAIAVALLAFNHPLGVVPAALLWGGLKNGAGLMQLRSGVSGSLIQVVLGLVILVAAVAPGLRRGPRTDAGRT